MLIRSTLLHDAGFAHAFSLRTGGVSEGPFATLNLGRSLGDDADAVAENHRRFAEAVGYAGIFELSQVHGTRLREVASAEDPIEVRREEGDALLTSEPGVAIGIRVADCVPVLIGDVASGRVAAAHAGWRGVASRIVPMTVERLLSAGSAVGDLRVALGPHIRAASFEVGDDVAATLAESVPASHPASVVQRGAGKPTVDLAAILRAQLLALGLDASQLDDVGGCTLTEPERFFSFRRDGQRSGRHLGAIVARRAAVRAGFRSG